MIMKKGGFETSLFYLFSSFYFNLSSPEIALQQKR